MKLRHSTSLLRNLAIIGAILFVVGLGMNPERTWTGYLVAFNYLAGLGLAGAVFLALLCLCNARWADGLTRVPAAMSRSLPAAAACGLILLAGVPTLYEWSHPEVVSQDHLLQEKAAWLNYGGFSARLVMYFAVWIAMAWMLVRTLVEKRDVERPRKLRLSALFMAVFALTYSGASVDWIQSLEPHWFSTIFALRTATGVVLSGLAAAVLIILLAKPFSDLVTKDQLHDLGKLMLSFSILWVYIWYCQWMLIWYSNIPEETGYYLARASGGWSALTVANLTLNWLVPFLVLLPRPARGSPAVLLRIALVLLVGRAVDLFVQIAPPLYDDLPMFGAWEAGPIVAGICLFFFITLKILRKTHPVPRTA